MSKRDSNPRLPLSDNKSEVRDSKSILADVLLLCEMHKKGLLGGEIMPEDAHPDLPSDSEDLARYFTLGMSLNYQRNSYSLWQACTRTYEDSELKWVFDPNLVLGSTLEELAPALLHHKIALQPNRHPKIWKQNADSLSRMFDGNVRHLFRHHHDDLGQVRAFLSENKKLFPYLCGPKISNYWLYVMSEYMSWPLENRHALSVAPDTHVINASLRLGLVSSESTPNSKLSTIVAGQWRDLLHGSELSPIDVHTPLWLWSRAGFPALTLSQ